MENFTDNIRNIILNKSIKLGLKSDCKFISIFCKESSAVIDAIKKQSHIDDFDIRKLALSDFKEKIDNKEKIIIIEHLPDYDESYYNDIIKSFNNNDSIGFKIFIIYKEDDIDSSLLNLFLNDNFYNIFSNLKKKKRKNALINDILNSSDGHEILKKYHPALYLAISFMIKNIYNDITLEEVSKSSYVSSSHLSYLFRTKLDTNFKSVMFILRVNEARKLIKENPKENLTNIAVKVGFYDLSHFGKTFKKYEGLSLGQFRKTLSF
ncbi:helix-turn-helix domain-containing protein [Photobacterium leiognathi]|uniref:helix-turn-helix domain-containing protein n=1 Tax=Photobacterium leiognathi TaxID=553611 RepID=UPI002981BB9D|nr:helix-turn-helix domain-containing protein [Photobacterium leiognathi]